MKITASVFKIFKPIWENIKKTFSKKEMSKFISSNRWKHLLVSFAVASALSLGLNYIMTDLIYIVKIIIKAVVILPIIWYMNGLKEYKDQQDGNEFDPIDINYGIIGGILTLFF